LIPLRDCQGIFLCPMLESCWLIHLHIFYKPVSRSTARVQLAVSSPRTPRNDSGQGHHASPRLHISTISFLFFKIIFILLEHKGWSYTVSVFDGKNKKGEHTWGCITESLTREGFAYQSSFLNKA